MTDSLETRLDSLASQTPSLIKCARHATLALKIYNYTSQTQYKRYWTRETLMARGLVLEAGTSTIIARPIETFFNHDANLHKPPRTDSSFTALEKVDGSLGLWFCYRGQWMMATRGSFSNAQVTEATKMAVEIGLGRVCDEAKTYCFEIVYPGNRVLVDYGGTRELVLLAVVDTQSGFDEPNAALVGIAGRLGVRVARVFDTRGRGLEVLRDLGLENEEGVVVRFEENGERVKVKFSWYVGLVKARNSKSELSLSEKVLCELVKDPMGKAETLLAALPDECYDEVRVIVEDFSSRFGDHERAFDRVAVRYRDTPFRDIPNKLSGKSELCKWLNMVRTGTANEEMKDGARKEYAVEAVRSSLKLEGKLKKLEKKR